ncbi:MAG: glutathione transferase GstA [Alphaproteobacteria bacterium]|nr:glutathione transferase GstA [Alphaproteobacteria bacterium]
MLLYYAPGLCSLAPHIALRRIGAAFDIEKVDMPTRRTEHGADFRSIKPSGKIPALLLDSGELLTETIAILLYVADLAPRAGLAPPAGTIARYTLTDSLSFIASELHKSFVPLFSKTAGPEIRAEAKRDVMHHLQALDLELTDKNYCFGDAFTVADAYLYCILGWPSRVEIGLAGFPALTRYRARMEEEPGVLEAVRAESLK